MPTGIVQDIFLDSGRPNYLNYGALGSIIGHEIAHAFTKFATTHDSDEEREIITAWYNSTPQMITEIFLLNTTKLWQNDSLDALNSKIKCIKDELAKTVSIIRIYSIEYIVFTYKNSVPFIVFFFYKRH